MRGIHYGLEKIKPFPDFQKGAGMRDLTPVFLKK